MAFLSISGLKKVYDSLEGEITKTFDSSRPVEDAAAPCATDETSHEKEEVAPPSPRGEEASPARREGLEENWGEWEEQDGGEGGGGVSTSTSTTKPSRGMQLSKKKKEVKKEPSPASPLPVSSDGGSAVTPTPLASSTPAKPGGKVGESGGSAVTPTPLASSTPAKPGGKLDSLPRAELVKYIKKQAQLLQKSKAHCDELSKECSELKKVTSSPPLLKTSDNEGLMEELQVVRGERDKAVGEQRTLQQTITGLEQDKQTLGEQVTVLEKKVKQLQSLEEDWRCRDEVATTKLSAQQQEMERVKKEFEDRLTSLQQELECLREGEEGRREREGERVGELQREIEALVGRLEVSEEEVEREKEEVVRVREELESVRRAAEKARCESEQEREERAALEAELRVQNSEAAQSSAEEKGEMEKLRSEFSSLQDQLTCACREKDRLQTELSVSWNGLETARTESESSRAEMERLMEEMTSLQRDHDQVQQEVKSLQDTQRDHDQVQQEVKSLQDTQRDHDQVQQEVKSLQDTQRDHDQVQQEVKSLQDTQRDHDQVQQEVKSLQDTQREYGSLQTEYESLVRERDRLQEECTGLHSDRDELRTVSDSLRRDLEEVRESHVRERETLLGQVRETEVRASEAERLLATGSGGGASGDGSEVHSGVVEELEWKIQSLESRLTSVSTEKETLQTSSEAVSVERETLVTQLAAEQKMSEEREAAVASLKNVLEERNRKLEGLEGECAALRVGQEGVAKEQEEEVERLRKEVDELERGREEVERRLEAVREESELAVNNEQETMQRSLEEQASDHRDETKKLKGYIVKMKKELADLRGKMAAPSEERDDLQRQVEELRVSVEAEKQSVVESEARRVESEEALKSLKEELGSLHSERDGLQSSLAAATEEVSTLRSELSTAQSDLVTFQTQVGGAQRVAEMAEKEAESLREELEREKESRLATKQKLTAAVKEAKVTSVMNLELADYQRSLQALEERLATAQGELEQAKEESHKQLDKMEALRKEMDLQTQQCISVEDKLSKTKALWMKTKKELDISRKGEGELQAAIVSLNAQLEGGKQLSEQSKAEMSTLTAKLQSMQQQSDSSVGVLQKTVRSLEHKLTATQNELTSSQLALSQCQQDYNSYKVRVHSVLKQKSSGPSPAEISTEIRQKFETEIIQLRADLQDSKSQLSAALAELEEVSEEHQLLSSTHTQLMKDSLLQLTAAKKQLEGAESRHRSESREQAELIEQLRQEVTEVTEAFRGQLHSLQEEHHRVVGSLQNELELSKRTLTKLQQDDDARVLARASNHVDRSSNSTHLGHMTSRDLKLPESAPSGQRSAGEGMDQAELDSNPAFSPSPLSREDSQLSFERLLSRADSEGPRASLTHSDSRTHTSRDGTVSDREPQLCRELAMATKTIRGLNELLRESEEATVRLGEQSKLLKEEIRRLERNREREEGVSNMEYLKNVVLKFLHSSDSDEQTALVPVITQLLCLSPQEMRFLQDTVKGTPAPLPDASSTLASPTAHSGLAGYVHRWTGY